MLFGVSIPSHVDRQCYCFIIHVTIAQKPQAAAPEGALTSCQCQAILLRLPQQFTSCRPGPNRPNQQTS